MSRSSPAPSPEPQRAADQPAPLVDALGDSITGHTARSETPRDADHHRGPRSHRGLRLAAIAAVAVLVLLALVLIV